jgi:hypothetical protein
MGLLGPGQALRLQLARAQRGLSASSLRHLSTRAAALDVPPGGQATPDATPVEVTFGDISLANYRIRPGVIRTSVHYSRKISALLKAHVWLKNEIEHPTGSFKERGARNALLLLDDATRRQGCIAASAGNHALALAYHGSELGVPVTVVMPKIAPLAKVHEELVWSDPTLRCLYPAVAIMRPPYRSKTVVTSGLGSSLRAATLARRASTRWASRGRRCAIRDAGSDVLEAAGAAVTRELWPTQEQTPPRAPSR